MRKLMLTFAAAAVAFSTVAAGQQQSPPDGVDFELEVASGETGTVEGAQGTGGTTLADNDPENCNSGDYTWMCEKTLVTFTGSGEATVHLHWAYPSDYDVDVFESDADGSLGDEVATSGNAWSPVSTGFGLEPDELATFEAKRGKSYLVVVYFYAAGGGYTLDVSLA